MKNVCSEGKQVAEELSRLPKRVRARVRDAILRLVLVYKAENDGEVQLELALPVARGATKIEGNLYVARVESWDRYQVRAQRRKRRKAR